MTGRDSKSPVHSYRGPYVYPSFSSCRTYSHSPYFDRPMTSTLSPIRTMLISVALASGWVKMLEESRATAVLLSTAGSVSVGMGVGDGVADGVFVGVVVGTTVGWGQGVLVGEAGGFLVGTAVGEAVGVFLLDTAKAAAELFSLFNKILTLIRPPMMTKRMASWVRDGRFV